MKIATIELPHSSFLSVEKDLDIIIEKMCKNDRLLKLLYYNTPDALSKSSLTDEQLREVLANNIKIIPKSYIEDEYRTQIFIKFDNFLTSMNPEFRNNTIEFDVLCNYDNWQLDGYALRPFKIIAELDSMFNGARLTGAGLTEFGGATDIIATDQLAGYCIFFNVVHGGEDGKHALNPSDDDSIIENFLSMTE